MKISFITTVFNEEKTIDALLKSILNQSRIPDEIIIVDGGSTDNTLSVISNFKFQISNKQIKFKVIVRKGNRAVGRNEAIKNVTNEITACSDAGCILDKNWVKNITKPFENSKVDVVAGYYEGKAQNIFQKCLIPYVLVMEDKINPNDFLPASRSMAFKKSIWEKGGKFPEEFNNNEDYVFAKNLKKINAKIVFAKDAIVYWIPRNTFKEAFTMFYRFALGDVESGIWRSKVLLLFARYMLGLYLIFLSILYKNIDVIYILLIVVIFYFIWAIKKNYQYIRNKEAIKILPLLQLTADCSVLFGSIISLLKVIKKFNYFAYLNQNKFLFFIIFVYIFIMLLTLRWGIPNQSHPFPYHMDEWHQLHAIGTTFKYGTPNMEGSANGTMFHFLLSGFYLVPFTLFKTINPFVLQIDNLLMRERIFEILRLQTIMYGILSILTVYKIADLINVSKKITVFLFTLTPIWLMLSGYYKYDIALMFWILLSLLFIIRFSKNPTNRNFIIAAIPSSLAVAVKVSAAPIFIAYIFSYFLFNFHWKKNLKYLFSGIYIFIFTLFLLGFPDTLFGKGNILYYLYNNIIESRYIAENLNLGIDPRIYLFNRHYPMMFGRGLVILFAVSILILTYKFFRKGLKKTLKQYKNEIFLLFSLFIFYLSLLTISLASAGNRTLVLLPFLVLIIGIAINKIITIKKFRSLVIFIILFVVIVQIYESFAWVSMKIAKSPQEVSSIWIEKNIEKGQTIGIENIPIYQLLPDIIQKEFYFAQYGIENKNKYKYEIVDSKINKLPSIVVITNAEIEKKLIGKSPKIDLLIRLERENYKKVFIFQPDLRYYKLFGDETDYYISGIVTMPVDTSIYRK